MIFSAELKNLKTREIKTIELQCILKSYTSFNGSSIQNYYKIDKKEWAIYITLIKTDFEFEQIINTKRQLI